MKISDFFKTIPDEIWYSEKVQEELKEMDEAEYQFTPVSEIKPDALTQAAIEAFKQVLEKRETQPSASLKK